ncbi:cytochrome P450 4F11-like, partial [Saccoglossus kowalevskii]|uniref:Cytochrome P450 4F11-like n=1 Tax=Saccoglossus kowalevskii TaxID=10224 RepID=A0ABM0MIL7_SACKO
PKNPMNYDVPKEWFGDSLLVSSGAKWKRQRRLLTPVFHFDMLKPYVDVYNDCVEVLMDKWKRIANDGPIEIWEDISLLTLDSLLKCIFGVTSNCQVNKEHDMFVQTVKNFTRFATKKIRFANLPPLLFRYFTSEGRQWEKTLQFLHNYSRQVIRNKKVQTNREDNKCLDFLDILLEAKYEDGSGLTDQEIQNEVSTFLFAGHDTTASGISWCLYNLARYPEYQQTCRKEIDELMEKKENMESKM